MSKFRVSPVILTDGVSMVKGKAFDSWRTVGSVTAAIRLFEARDVDEIFLLDVKARSKGELISEKLVSEIAKDLRIPLCVGGGINTVGQISRLLDLGADRVVIGSAAYLPAKLVQEASDLFGSQAVVCSLDYRESQEYGVFVNSGSSISSLTLLDAVSILTDSGAGEILLQSIDREGSGAGFDLEGLRRVREATNLPITVSGGLGRGSHAFHASTLGANAVGVGSAFLFSEVTPLQIKLELIGLQIQVRLS
jgi:cyclase